MCGGNSGCPRESSLDEFSSSAVQAIHDYLAQTSPDYAVRIVDRLTRRSIQIAAFPNSGRMVPEYDRRKSAKLSKDGIELSIWLR